MEEVEIIDGKEYVTVPVKRMGAQDPTYKSVIPYKVTKGMEAVFLYQRTERRAIQWQVNLIKDIMAVNEDGLWTHQKFGYEVPRRNGKNEIIVMREMWGLLNGEKICHTAHRTSTSHNAWVRLAELLKDAGYTEIARLTPGKDMEENTFHTTRALGLETVEMWDGGRAVFRTRTKNGGLGEGFDCLIIDEAQEYTTSQQGALSYTVSDSRNPQTILCGTPPTMVSEGDVFPNLRKSCIDGTAYETGWAEWSIDREPKEPLDVDLWYACNPSLGWHLGERKIRAEYDPRDPLDFIIQRLGYWYTYSLKSAITEQEWRASEVKKQPKLEKERYFAVKFGHDGANAVMTVAAKSPNGVYVEAIDIKPIRDGIEWVLRYLGNPNTAAVIVDGDAGKEMLKALMKEAKVKKPIFPTVQEVITANAKFENAVFNGGISHVDQPLLRDAISNCQHRPIGSKGGFGYKTTKDDCDVTLVEATALAYWAASEAKAKKVQKVFI